MGHIFKRTYKNKKTGERRECSNWSIKYYRDGRPYYESSGSAREGDANLRLRQSHFGHNDPQIARRWRALNTRTGSVDLCS